MAAGQPVEALLIDDRDALAASDPAVCVIELGAVLLADLERVGLSGDDDRRRPVDAALDDGAGLLGLPLRYCCVERSLPVKTTCCARKIRGGGAGWIAQLRRTLDPVPRCGIS